MIRHLAQMSAMSLIVVTFMLLPFLPGEYDGLATSLSAVAQLFAVIGVVLVPFGAIWLAYELRTHPPNTVGRASTGGRYWLALASVAIATVVGAIVALSAFLSVGPSLGFGAVALLVWCLAWVAPKLKALRSGEIRTFTPAPMYLIVVPMVAVISRIALLGPASEFSRNRALENSATLIGDIERYRGVHGQYPRSLLSVWKDYKPSVMGIERYHYEPNGDAYNVYFENGSDRFGTREFVMYNRRDEHEMTSHAMDRLLSPPEAGRGYYAVHDASRPHWKRFLFD